MRSTYPMRENIPSRELAGCIGFTKDEVGSICAKYDTSYEECMAWYNGYEPNGVSICDPKSIVEAALTKEFACHIARRHQLRQEKQATRVRNGNGLTSYDIENAKIPEFELASG